ncbi:MAG: hypothetical protein WBD63_08995 [Phycisphaerae bacterium]
MTEQLILELSVVIVAAAALPDSTGAGPPSRNALRRLRRGASPSLS